MAPKKEEKRKEDFDEAWAKLTDKERIYFSGLSVLDRIELFNTYAKYDQDQLRILKKYKEGKTLTVDEQEFLNTFDWKEVEALDEIVDVFFFSALSKLSKEEKEAMSYAASFYPEFFRPEIKLPKVPKVPEIKPPKVPEIEVAVRIPKPEEMKKYPWKWRSQFPFQTSTFIKEFLLMRKIKGAYPYEIYKAYKITLWKTIMDDAYRQKIIEEGAIKLNGEMINSDLTFQISRDMRGLLRACPGVHIPTYTSFWKYFMILNFLGLIKKKGKKKKTKKSIFKRQIYIVNKEMEGTLLWEEGWRRPQEIAYPLSGIGQKKYDKLQERAERRGITIQEVFVEYLLEVEKLDELAEIRGISERELAEQILNSKYFSK